MVKPKDPTSLFDDLIALDELSAITGRNPNTLRDWARAGLLPGKKLSERVYVVSRSLFLESLGNGVLADRFSAREVKQILERFQSQEVKQ